MLSPILAVADIDASVAFYTRTLGFEHGFSMPDDDGKTSFASVSLGEAEILLGVLEGFVAPEDRHKRGIGFQIYINLPADMDIDALYAQAKEQGANITKEIATRDWGERAFTLLDPDGYNLMFAQQPKKV
jgi:uncharacterized glyoxalase superfamily protein PhnB